jgi:succinoglycan biosynthesis protein ExoA
VEQRSEQTYEIVRRDRVAITAVVPTYNEEAHIGGCLLSLLAQRDLPGGLEILVVDGCSADRTADIVRSFPEYGTSIRLIQNPRRLQVYAWNLAMREAQGEYYAMIGAHAEYGPTYFADCLDVMKRTGAAAVGGVQRPYGESFLSGAIAYCMSSAMGMGNARFRYTKQEEETESVFAMFTRTQTLRNLGGFDESLPFDEDSDMNYRLRRSGGKIVVSPKIRVKYAVRRSLRALWKQMYRYGYWRRFTQLKHSGAVPLRVYAPAALVGALALSAACAAGRLWLPAAIVPVLYLGFIVSGALVAARSLGPSAICVPVVLATMHAGYGVGYWKALAHTRSALLRKRAHSLSH